MANPANGNGADDAVAAVRARRSASDGWRRNSMPRPHAFRPGATHIRRRAGHESMRPGVIDIPDRIRADPPTGIRNATLVQEPKFALLV